MRLGVRDAIATIIVAAIVVPFVGYLAWGSVPFIQDPVGMSAVGLVGGGIAAYVGGWLEFAEGAYAAGLKGGLAILSLVLGVLTLVSENFLTLGVRDGLLAAFIGTIVLMWGFAIADHATARPESRGGLRPV